MDLFCLRAEQMSKSHGGRNSWWLARSSAMVRGEPGDDLCSPSPRWQPSSMESTSRYRACWGALTLWRGRRTHLRRGRREETTSLVEETAKRKEFVDIFTTELLSAIKQTAAGYVRSCGFAILLTCRSSVSGRKWGKSEAVNPERGRNQWLRCSMCLFKDLTSKWALMWLDNIWMAAERRRSIFTPLSSVITHNKASWASEPDWQTHFLTFWKRHRWLTETDADFNSFQIF